MYPKRTKERNFKIYALYDLENKTVFLGKSYAKSFTPIYSKHLCGKNPYTKKHYGKSPPLTIPQFCVLDSIVGDYKTAYRHLVAWTRIFLEADFTLLMQRGTISNATALTPATKSIYDTICADSLDTILQQGEKCSAHPPPNKQEKVNIDKERTDVIMQFNMRLFQSDIEHFNTFCQENGYSRREGFSLLLNHYPYGAEDRNSFAFEEIHLLKQHLAEQAKTLQKAQNKAERLSVASSNYSDRFNRLLDTVQHLLRTYCEIVCLDDVQPFEKLKIVKYENVPYRWEYEYPKEEIGIQIITLKHLAYSKGRKPAIFILGKTEDDQLCKFRNYPKHGYIGIPIPRSSWTYTGAKWLVTWQRVGDGAVELTGSLPITDYLNTLIPDDYSYSEASSEEISPFDKQLRIAQARAKRL